MAQEGKKMIYKLTELGKKNEKDIIKIISTSGPRNYLVGNDDIEFKNGYVEFEIIPPAVDIVGRIKENLLEKAYIDE